MPGSTTETRTSPLHGATADSNEKELLLRRIGLAILFVIAVASAFFHPWPEDFGEYAKFGNLILAHAKIYSTPTETGTPFFFLVCVPIALFYNVSPRMAVIAWAIPNYAALVLTLSLAARMIYGRKLTLGAKQPIDPGTGKEELSLASPEILVPLFFTLPYLVDHFQFHQINLIILALAFGGLYLHENGRRVAGATALGAAAAIKVMPIVFVPYLAYRRRWGAALSTTAATVVFWFSPLLVFSWTDYWTDLSFWWHRMVVGHGPWNPGGPNQSIFAMWDRIVGHGLVPFAAAGIDGRHTFFSGDPRVRLAWAFTLAIVGLLTLLAFRGGLAGRSSKESLWIALMEWSALFMISELFSPVMWIHYLVLLILPYMILYAVWRSPEWDDRARQACGAVLLLCGVMGFGTGYGLMGRAFALRLETGSIVTYAVLIVLATMLWLRRRFAMQKEARLDAPGGQRLLRIAESPER